MKNYTLYAIRYTLCFIFIFSSLGCDAFVRKFTRKPKREDLPMGEMVLAPEEYKGPQMSKEELYRQYFLFWKSWHDELIVALSGGSNHKKQVDCTDESIRNLNSLRALLNEAAQEKIDNYINELTALRGIIAGDLYGNGVSKNRITAERLKRNILRDFSYNKIKGDLV